MTAFLEKTYYGNSVTDWLIAFAIIFTCVLLARVVYWLFSNIVRRLTAKSSTKLDDLFVDMVEEPLVFIIVLAGIWYAISTLTVPAAVDKWVGNITQVLIALSVTWLASRLFDALYREYIVPVADKTDTDLDDQLLPLARKAAKVVIWAMGIIIALNNAGYDVAALLAGLGIGGLALAMAAKDTVSNVFGGFTIFADRPFKLNDRIKIAGHDGTVTEIGIRSTRLQTLDGRIVTIPNSKFSDSTVENVSDEPSRKVSSNLGLVYDTTPDQVRKGMTILREIVAANDALKDKHTVSFNEFGDSAMNILFIYYIKKGADIAAAQTEVNLAILERFTAAGLDFAFPTQTLYTKTV